MEDLRQKEGDKKETLLVRRKSRFISYLRIYSDEVGRRREGKQKQLIK